MLPILFAALAAFFIAMHLATLSIAWFRCRPRPRREVDARRPGITVVRPLCGVETFSAETIAAAFASDYPSYELLFCVANADDPIVPLVEAAIAAHPRVAARLLIGDDRIGMNPKLNNMVKGWREATHEWIVFIDSNVLCPPDFVDGVMSTVRADTGAVSAPPCGIRPEGFGAHLECAFLNTFEARWQYVADTLGNGFAQGKTLLYRKADLDRSGLRDLATEPAEDAATTKMVRRMNKRVRLASCSPQPLGVRPLRNVWRRQLRWARMRRVTFPLEYLPEILCGTAVPALAVIAAAVTLDWPVAATAAVYFAVWYAAEWGLAVACGWPAGWRLAGALVVRDLLMPALYVGAFTGRSFDWNGTVHRMAPRSATAARDAIEDGA